MNIHEKIGELVRKGSPFVLVTVISADGSSPARTGFRMTVEPGGVLSGTIGGGALEKTAADEAADILAGKKPFRQPERKSINLASLGMTCGGRVELLTEYFGGGRSFVLFGGGHLGRALSPIMELLGYSVTVIDNRPEIRELIETPERRTLICGYDDVPDIEGILAGASGCFIATHGHEWDYTVLKQVISLAAELPYIGMIGSKAKVAVALRKIEKEGLSIPETLYSPVGLRIGGDSAAEIAVGIAAEFIAVNNEKKL